MSKSLKCSCGAVPSSDEFEGCGEYEEDGETKFICLTCWCAEHYGKGTIEHLEAKAGRTLTNEEISDFTEDREGGDPNG